MVYAWDLYDMPTCVRVDEGEALLPAMVFWMTEPWI